MLTKEKPITPSRALPDLTGPTSYPWFWAINAFFLLALVLWFFLDHSWPYWDAAEHIKNAFQYQQLLRHPKFWDGGWLHEFLTINYCYPQTIHVFHGLLKALFGSGRWVDSLLLVVFAATLNVSVYGIGWLLFKDRLAAALSVLFINCYPVVVFHSHENMLDFPHLSMFTLAMLGLLWWREQPSMKRAALCGISLGLAFSAKQTGIFFVGGPVAALLILSCWRKRFAHAQQLICASIIGALFLLPWLIPNVEGIVSYMVRNNDLIGEQDRLAMFRQSLFAYVAYLSMMLSPLLLALAAIASVVSWPKTKHVLILVLAGAAGLILMSLLSFQLPEHRYIIPCVLAPALITGYLAARGLSHKAMPIKVATLLILGISVAQFICAFYSPYPISRPAWVTSMLALNPYPAECPTPGGDLWGQDWVIQNITQADEGAASWLQVMPSTTEISVHTLELVARFQRSNVRPTTQRLWGPRGDKFELKDKDLTHFRWFLLKSGRQGRKLRDEASRRNYLQVEHSVKSGGRFVLTGRMKLPDGSLLYLYRQK